MKKPLNNFERKQRFVRLILQQSSTTTQLVKQSRCNSLTDSLSILENSGYTGDLAIFVLANLQSLEVEA
ncbi:hypothetical protein NIES4072_03930 [Nostoc commune NIES-4072]|uniref:Uncharacterized protein n=1 Tax=Nostoc commune NIES-4072 TaxID=2005467 RepID=A0A2R5FEA1_NOSCO|nr:hypothetical protein NIES4070_22890 [Nostoc commune HK-02]GBG16747.1 hypothetical protein NIES4072_03930 [Nostoc commune NIES-4072]